MILISHGENVSLSDEDVWNFRQLPQNKCEKVTSSLEVSLIAEREHLFLKNRLYNCF